MSERTAVFAAVLSSAFGGTAAAVTRFVIGAADPITLAAFRFGIGFLILLPIAVAARSRWPQSRDWIGVAGLGILFFAIFFVLYNIAFSYTTVARGALALSALPLLTMVVGAALGIERLTGRKTLGVLVAMGGVAAALVSGLAHAPEGAWRGDLIMTGAALCMALYNVWSRPFIARSSPLAFLTAGMGIGALCLVIIAGSMNGFSVARGFHATEWSAMLFLGLFGAVLNFYLWVFALERTTPTRVANTITVNPVTASILAAILLGEPIGINLIVGILAVCFGIWIASTDRRPRTAIVTPSNQE
jgi:drug/metabolite transporter (DMT)-like permease